ncbi:MAG TPA: TolC family protein [Bryobacteraceae bacterium]|nr:TolC family protein [Bryobacteraceae bacterium]
MHRWSLLLLLVTVPWLCSAADSPAERAPLQLTIKRAVELALSPEGNTYIQLSGENLRQAKSRSAEVRSLLLPDIEAQAEQTTAMRSLAALGLDLAASDTLLGAAKNPPPCTASTLICGVLSTAEAPLLTDIADKIPRVVGPFNSVDVRARLTQSVFDFSSIRRYQSSRAAFRAAKNDRSAADNSVSTTVAKAYLAALRANADVEAYQANVSLAEAVLKQSENQRTAGTGTGIEVTRAKVQLANEKQHLLVVQNERNKAQLQLLRTMGLSLSTELELTDKLSYEQVDAITLEQAEAEAVENRPDVKAQAEREASSRLNANAVKSERLPSLVAYADYGTTGTNGSTVALLPTRDYGVSLRVPIFDGGRRDARRAEFASQFRQERVRSNDLHEQIELEVRMALDSLHSAEEQVKVAEAGLSLAQSELTQARRRYDAGVASRLEVTDAQTRLERARDNQIAALFNHNVSRFDLGQATGTIREMVEREPSGRQRQPVMNEPQVPEAIDIPPAPAMSVRLGEPPPPLAPPAAEPRIPAVLAVSWRMAPPLRAARSGRTVPVRKVTARRPSRRPTRRHASARKTRRATKMV